MSRQARATIQSLSKQLDERMTRLKTAMEGRELKTPYEVSGIENPEAFVYVSPSQVRVAVDDFNTILKEIKRVLK